MKSTCRFCGQPKVSLLYPANNIEVKTRVADYACTNSAFGVHGPILKCDHCGIIYVDEELTQDQVSTYYEVADDPLYFAEQEARRKTFEKYLKKLPGQGKLLDIGTNTGLFVKIALDNGWNATGLEPNKWGVAYAKKNYGIALVNKPFDKGTFKKESFDIVTMWDVIEHFMDPVFEMAKVYDILKPGGVFAFSTIDPESLLAKAMGTKWSWYMEMHKVFFNKKSAEYYLKKSGFKKIIFMPHFRNLSLGYLATRLEAINPVLSKFIQYLVSSIHLSKTIVPYYANDLYDCYAFK